MIVHDDSNKPTGRKTEIVEELFIWVAVHENGVEGIVAYNSLPLVTSSEPLAHQMRQAAIKTRELTNPNLKLRLLRFSTRQIMEEIS